MSERREHAAAASTREADASPILVWNGLVTRMRRVGAERRRMRLSRTPTAHSSEHDDLMPTESGARLPRSWPPGSPVSSVPPEAISRNDEPLP